MFSVKHNWYAFLANTSISVHDDINIRNHQHKIGYPFMFTNSKSFKLSQKW